MERCHCKDGTDLQLLIHREVQSQVEEGFTERMYLYTYRIYELYKQMVIRLMRFNAA